jgi:phosphotransferase family enzyme
MIEGLDNVLEGCGQPGLIQLRGLLENLLGGREAEGRVADQQVLQPRSSRVFRLRFLINGQSRQVIVKRLRPDIAQCIELLERRWLPAAGMSEHGPALLGSVAEPGGKCVWHVYTDLGDCELDTQQLNREHIAAATGLIARLHTRFARHPLLGEVRLHGGDLGIHFYEANVRDAIYALKGLHPTAQETPLCHRLFERLFKLRQELPQRAKLLEELGGPETLLHGDLWAINIFVIPTDQGLHARLIDWDHAAVGPASYDLSTFLLRLPSEERAWVLGAYRNETARAGWTLPSTSELNFLFETAECARIANRIIWPAIALVQDQAPWGWEALAEIDQWFENLKPVLPWQNEAQTAAS